jgi:hypothetical protein
VIKRIKPKSLNGRKLNGEMLYNLANSYVTAINTGAVPSIESSWSYICKNQCQKAVEESYAIFEKNFMEQFTRSAPMYEDELKDFYHEAKTLAMHGFEKVAVGEVKAEFLKILKEKFHLKLKANKLENEKICEHECNLFLNHNF